MSIQEEEFNELEKRYYLIKKTEIAKFIGLVIATAITASGITTKILERFTEKGSTTITTSNSSKEVKYYSKTFLFWVPVFKGKDSLNKQKEFNQFLKSRYDGFTRWEVSGQSGNDSSMEQGWLYQISMSKEHSGVEIENIIEQLSPRFKEEHTLYVTKFEHDK